MIRLEKNALDEKQMLEFAANFASVLRPCIIYLEGNLGAGKTTFSRGLVQALGHDGAVKSPTFTLVEPYENLRVAVYHFDLYRLSEPEELEYMGARDYFSGDHICLIEWAVKGEGHIPAADLVICLERSHETSRDLLIEARTDAGQAILADVLGNV